MADSTPRQRVKRWRVVITTSVVAVAVVLVAVVGPGAVWRKLMYMVNRNAYAPSCSSSANIEHADADQDGLIRCYLKAVADHSTSELQAVVPSADYDGPTGFNAADISHTADVRSGTDTVTVVPNEVDSADAEVTIHYANGAHDNHDIHLADPTSSHSWRFWDVGTNRSLPSSPPTAGP